MDYNFIEHWLNMHDIVLEQSFVTAIKDLAVTYKKNLRTPGEYLLRTWMLQAKFVLLGEPLIQHAVSKICLPGYL